MKLKQGKALVIVPTKNELERFVRVEVRKQLKDIYKRMDKLEIKLGKRMYGEERWLQ